MGRNASDFRVLFALLLWAAIDGVASAREIERLSERNRAYEWLRGGVPLNYHMLSDFRTQHADLLDRLLSQSLACLMNEGLVDVDTTAQDGMKVRTVPARIPSAVSPSWKNTWNKPSSVCVTCGPRPTIPTWASAATRPASVPPAKKPSGCKRPSSTTKNWPPPAKPARRGRSRARHLQHRSRGPQDADERRRLSPGRQRAVRHHHRHENHRRHRRYQPGQRRRANAADDRRRSRSGSTKCPTTI